MGLAKPPHHNSDNCHHHLNLSHLNRLNASYLNRPT